MTLQERAAAALAAQRERDAEGSRRYAAEALARRQKDCQHSAKVCLGVDIPDGVEEFTLDGLTFRMHQVRSDYTALCVVLPCTACGRDVYHSVVGFGGVDGTLRFLGSLFETGVECDARTCPEKVRQREAKHAEQLAKLDEAPLPVVDEEFLSVADRLLATLRDYIDERVAAHVATIDCSHR